MANKDIWLARDERKLLAFYARQMPRPKDFETYRDPVVLMKVLGYRAKQNVKPEDSPYLQRVWDTNDMLHERGLIRRNRDATGMDVTISLMKEGFYLGWKYAHWISRTQLWFMEYKQHWILLGLAWALAVTIASLISTAITLWLMGKQQ